MTDPRAGDVADELAQLRRRVERERAARLEAEAIAERVTRELYDKGEIMQMLEHVAAAANEASTVDAALRLAVTHICKGIGWPVGHVLMPGVDSTWISADIWYVEDEAHFEEFRTATATTVFPVGVGLPGQVAATRQPAWVAHMPVNADASRAHAAARVGIAAGMALPVFVGTEVVAVLEFFATYATAPSPAFLDAALHIGHHLGRAVERERAARALRESERLYRLVAEHVTDVIFVYGLDLRPTYISPSAVVLRGYSIGEMMNQSLTERLTPASADLALKTLAEVMADRGAPYVSRTLDLEVTCKDGSTKWTETLMSFLRDERGRPAGILGVARDITERRTAEGARVRLEEQLRQAQKMDAIGRLAGGVAHDFNNLLTVIGGRVGLVLGRTNADDRAYHDLTIIADATERASALTRQLLAFSRKQDLEPRVLDLNGVVERLTALLHRLIREDIELRVFLRAAPSTVLADPGQLEQVLMNLVVNARDAMPRGGQLTIETANADLDDDYVRTHVDSRPGPHVRLAVTDTGVGMDAATRTRIFEPFFTTKPEGKGTGLGLATVFGIVTQSGGTIWVYSELGRGTTFKIYLPLVEAAATTQATIVAAPPPRGTETILLVEDDDGVRTVGEDILRRLGYTVLPARNGEDGLRASARHPQHIALLVTDIVMPNMSGPALYARLRAERPGTKVLFLSGYASDAIGRQGILDPDAAFLEKPLTAESLGRKVRAVLDDR